MLGRRPILPAEGRGWGPLLSPAPTPSPPMHICTRITNFLLVQEIYGLEHAGSAKPAQAAAEDSEEGLCVICLVNDRNTTVLPCRHMCMCHECAQVRRPTWRMLLVPELKYRCSNPHPITTIHNPNMSNIPQENSKLSALLSCAAAGAAEANQQVPNLPQPR
jgi:hypothetical protein